MFILVLDKVTMRKRKLKTLRINYGAGLVLNTLCILHHSILTIIVREIDLLNYFPVSHTKKLKFKEVKSYVLDVIIK